ncbi:hypothetical protein [Cohnella zeiphila]|uniref:DUF4179 domain-containing protein n=1 Tax=Cohnella zeiphila TaxID=2761120 RepID=A0A7X0SIY3_9BACL|nr:hypothetical protein [Cohnella zeiphila]MBB6730812.1 hypothetical protein [Cohnella zeiphila]
MNDDIRETIGGIPLPPELSERSRLGIERARSERRRGRSRRWYAATAAVVLGLALFTLALTDAQVRAAIQKALQFVPGIGVMDDGRDQDAGADRLVLAEPIRLQFGEGEFVITGMSVDDQMTYLTFTEKNARIPQSVRITNEKGESFDVSISMYAGSSTEKTGSYWHKGKLDIGRTATLVFDAYPDTVVPLKLTPAPNYRSYEEMGPTQSQGGVSVTAVASRVGDRARITLVTPSSQDYYVDDYMVGSAIRPGRQLTVADDTGKTLAIEPERGTGAPLRTFYFPLFDDGSDRTYRITVPEIEVSYPIPTARLRLPIPAQGSLEIGQTVELAGFPITVTRVERTDTTTLRVYVDLHFDENDERSLRDFRLDGIGSMAKMNETTWATEFFEFEIDPGDKKAEVTLSDAEAIVRGPWTFTLGAKNFSQTPPSP